MLSSSRDLQGYGIEATNGSIGRVHEMLFHDDRWVIRYLVADHYADAGMAGRSTRSVRRICRTAR